MMHVQTFETDSERDEIDEQERLEQDLIINTLGLAGQQTATAKPYRLMTAAEIVLFGAALPVHTKITEYAGGRLPLRVLQVAAHALKVFDETEGDQEPSRMEVWTATSLTTSDSLLVCVVGKARGEQTYLLARWGEQVLDPAQLRGVACETIEQRARARIAAMRSKINQYEANLEASIEVFLATGEDETCWPGGLTLS